VKILVAINGSSQSEDIISFAMQFVLHAGEPPTILFVVKKRKDLDSDQIEKYISLVREHLGSIDLSTRVRSGDQAKEIMREAREGNYALIIMGETHTNYFTRLIRRSRTTQIVEDAPCPVIIVKGSARPIRRILLCDSGAGRSSVLSRFTLQLAEILEGEEEVTVLHVMSQISAGPGVPGRELRASVSELIEQHTPEGEFLGKDIQILEKPGIQPVPMVRHGLVVDEILAEAQRSNYDLIVIGAHRGRSWQHFLLEDITRKILIQADRPVMVVK
jgi:nucleotide-binding universal stress UspA family protein